eukprot:UN03661
MNIKVREKIKTLKEENLTLKRNLEESTTASGKNKASEGDNATLTLQELKSKLEEDCTFYSLEDINYAKQSDDINVQKIGCSKWKEWHLI